jgi:hypothetical protein
MAFKTHTGRKDYLMTIVRRTNSRFDKYSAEGREKGRTRAIPLMPQLSCLNEDKTSEPETIAK